MSKTLKARSLFFDLKRVEKVGDTGHLFVEGYTFVNPDAGDGFVWERSAMEAATPDYEQWGAIREMHQASAVGNAQGSTIIDGNEIPLGVTWDTKGAYLRALIVDPIAVEKVETGVYKGFSAKIKPTLMRGNAVKSCIWVENSLVDRPQDKGCAIERLDLLRVEGNEAEEFEVEEEDVDAIARFQSIKEARALLDLPPLDCYDQETIDTMKAVDRAEVIKTLTDDELSALMIERGITTQTPNLPIRENLEGGVRRFERSDEGGMSTDDVLAAFTDFQSRIETAEAALKPAKDRIEELERSAKPVGTPPVRYPEALERTFAAAHQSGAKERDEIQAEIARIEKEAPGLSEKERVSAVTQLQVLKGRLAAL